MLDIALLVVFGVGWLVAVFVVRRYVIREAVAGRMSIGTVAVLLGLVFGVLPIPAVIAFPDSLAPIAFASALLFVVAAGTTFAMARMVGLR